MSAKKRWDFLIDDIFFLQKEIHGTKIQSKEETDKSIQQVEQSQEDYNHSCWSFVLQSHLQTQEIKYKNSTQVLQVA